MALPEIPVTTSQPVSTDAAAWRQRLFAQLGMDPGVDGFEYDGESFVIGAPATEGPAQLLACVLVDPVPERVSADVLTRLLGWQLQLASELAPRLGADPLSKYLVLFMPMRPAELPLAAALRQIVAMAHLARRWRTVLRGAPGVGSSASPAARLQDRAQLAQTVRAGAGALSLRELRSVLGR